jgi:hypothetical protein
MTTNMAPDMGCQLSLASIRRYQFEDKSSRERIMHHAKERILFLLVAILVVASAVQAEVTGKITGVVEDPSGAVIVGAAVAVTNTATGVKQTTQTDQDGVFTFPVLSIGQYQIDVTSDGFKDYRKTGLLIDIDSALVVDVTLQVKEQDQSVMVTENAAHVETTDTQLGQVLGNKKVTEIPLNGRSYTDLFALQVGVTPMTTSGAGNSTSGGGFGTVPVAGGKHRTVFDQRPARRCQWFLLEWSERAGRHQSASGDYSESRFHRRVSNSHHQRRCGIRQL